MHALKCSIVLSCLLFPMMMFSMEPESTSSEISSSDEGSEYSSQDSSGSQEFPSQECPMCQNVQYKKLEKKIQAMLIRHSLVSAAKTIMQFNFEGSLGDCLLDHLHCQITTLMELETCSPLILPGIFKIKTTNNLIIRWNGIATRQHMKYVFDMMVDKSPGERASQNLRIAFEQAIESIEESIHTLYHLAEKNDALFRIFQPLLVDINNTTLKSVRIKFRKFVKTR